MKDVRNYKKNGVQFAYVLDCIDIDGNDNATDREKIEYVFERFRAYCNPFEMRKWPNEQERLGQFLRGLPIGIAFDNYNIAQIGKEWGYCKTPQKEAEFCENWWNTIALRLLQLRRILCK